MYQVIFRGERRPGVDEQTARNNVGALFKATPAQLDRMFSGQPVVIRNQLSDEEARKYQAVLERQGVICHIEPMPGFAAPGAPAQPQPSAPPSAPTAAAPAPAPVARRPTGAGVKVEPGERLPVAGERVDDILRDLSWSLDPVGTTLAEPEEVVPPVFEHLDEITIAPPGADIGVPRDLPPPVVPDTSHLRLAEDETESDNPARR